MAQWLCLSGDSIVSFRAKHELRFIFELRYNMFKTFVDIFRYLLDLFENFDCLNDYS